MGEATDGADVVIHRGQGLLGFQGVQGLAIQCLVYLFNFPGMLKRIQGALGRFRLGILDEFRVHGHPFIILAGDGSLQVITGRASAIQCAKMTEGMHRLGSCSGTK